MNPKPPFLSLSMPSLIMKTSMFNVKNIAIKIIAIQALFMLANAQLHAQQVYKSVDKQGRVTYSEVPPAPGSEAKLTGESAVIASLPYALQQVVSRYPVTLYSSENCAACLSARLMLTQRGVPFTERTVSSNEDFEAYKRLNIDNTFPLITIAAQQLKGYEAVEWTQYLDAAGYPKTSTLPRNYKNPEPTSLAPKKAAEKEVADKPAARPARPATAVPQETNNNPAGIKF
jgi:glutaredoxin